MSHEQPWLHTLSQRLGVRLSEWPTLLKLAGWVSGIIGGFLLEPPPSSPEQPQTVANLSRFIIVATVAFSIPLTEKYSKRHHLGVWTIIGIISLLLTVVGWFAFEGLSTDEYWVCTVKRGALPVERYVKGDQPTPLAQSNSLRNPLCNSSCQALLSCNQYKPEQIWEKAGIERRRRILTILYFVVIPISVLCLTAIGQIFYCRRQPDLAPLYEGDWVGFRANEVAPSLKLELQYTGDRISGTAIVTKPSSISGPLLECRFKRGSLYFALDEGLEKKEYRMTISATEDSASLDKLDSHRPLHWRILKISGIAKDRYLTT